MRALAITLSIAAALAFAGLLGYSYWLSFGLWTIACSAGMALALPLSSLLHELGHMLAGLICKIKVKPTFRLFGNSYCEIMPKTEKHLKSRVFFTAAGGIIINLLIFAIGILGIHLGGYFRLVGVLMPSSIYLVILNIIPAHLADGKTDGLVCNGILNDTDEAKVMLAVLGAQAHINGGKDISELDKSALFDLPQIREDDPSFIALCELRYEYERAAGNEAEAEKYRTRFEQLKEEYM